MAAYEDFLPYVSPFVPGASDPLMVRAIRDACIDFCSGSLFLKQALEPIPTITGTPDYEIETPSGTRVHMIMSARLDDVPLEPVNMEGASNNVLSAEFGVEQDTGTPRRVVFSGIRTLLLDPAPDESGKELLLVAALTPTRTSDSVSDDLFEQYAEAIGYGAVSKLAQIKGATYYDLVEAGSKLSQFTKAMNDARLKANAGGVGNRSLRVRFRKI